MKKSIPNQQTQANIAAILNLLASTPAALADLSVGMTGEQLHAPLGEGERSFAETLVHLIHCEALTSHNIYLALMVVEPLLPDIHPERDLGKLLRYNQIDFEFADLLVYFKFRRKVLLHVLRALTDGQWSRLMSEVNKQRKESVYWQARALALHELEHITDLQSKSLKSSDQ